MIIPVYQTARSADYFKNPDEYNPDRWKGEESKQNQFAFLPFGFGPRMCIGRRVAELEMRTTLAHVSNDMHSHHIACVMCVLLYCGLDYTDYMHNITVYVQPLR